MLFFNVKIVGKCGAQHSVNITGIIFCSFVFETLNFEFLYYNFAGYGKMYIILLDEMPNA